MDTVFGQAPVVSFLKSRIANPPNIILFGPTCVGKTMLANAWISEHLASQGATVSAETKLSLNNSDDRGIATIRQKLTDFVMRSRSSIAWVLVDDADNLPTVTQQALRRILELYEHKIRFLFISQTCANFIEPIQSRCVLLQCSPVDIRRYARNIMETQTDLKLSDDELRTLADMCLDGNARQLVLLFRAMALTGSTGSAGSLHQLVNGMPTDVLVRQQNAIPSRDIHTITESVLTLWNTGYSFEDCITMLETTVRTQEQQKQQNEKPLVSQSNILKQQSCFILQNEKPEVSRLNILKQQSCFILQLCGEAHIFQIQNRTTTLDLIAVLSGVASSTCLA